MLEGLLGSPTSSTAWSQRAVASIIRSIRAHQMQAHAYRSAVLSPRVTRGRSRHVSEVGSQASSSMHVFCSARGAELP